MSSVMKLEKNSDEGLIDAIYNMCKLTKEDPQTCIRRVMQTEFNKLVPMNRWDQVKPLLTMCHQFALKDNTVLFGAVVQNALQTLPWIKNMLAEEFEETPALVTRWGKNMSKPHPKMEQLIVQFVYEKTLIVHEIMDLTIGHV